ncbi:nitroreductase family protein [Salinicoccus halitifaciens]|uniref:Oxidoreductase (Fatty acid repression mutant protein) n=1 Tax=Salinicoccus halitifaciens TaxID=1073415 RepID=A0ABV2EA39_9STAP|nr:nitroreductase family protein [Salinicoccus halitifaciens]MCD2138411.1 nitroreductase family protein [Salinicoccus halitifaciens]
MSTFLDLVEKRRTVYALGTDSEYSKEDIENRIREIVKQVPTAFNIQTTRVVVLFDEANDKFWDHIYDVQKNVLEGEMWDMMSGVMTGAKKGIGTVLFFEDKEAVEVMPAQGARQDAYKQNNNANAQYAVWLALAEMDLGASLQHFNVGYEQGFDKGTKEMFNLPESYEMLAQMPFGSVEQEIGEKEHIDTEVQVKVLT